jgi:hypothetical protein
MAAEAGENGRHGYSPCSRNAHTRKVLVGRAQLGNNHATLENKAIKLK